MPTKRRRRLSEKKAPLTDGQFIQLVTGYDFFNDGYGRDIGPADEAMREAWQDHSEDIEQFCRENWPGSVPYARLRFGEGMSREAVREARARDKWKHAN